MSACHGFRSLITAVHDPFEQFDQVGSFTDQEGCEASDTEVRESSLAQESRAPWMASRPHKIPTEPKRPQNSLRASERHLLDVCTPMGIYTAENQ